MKQLTLTISGMHCASCASNIERSVSKVPGVRNVSVRMLSHKGVVECDDSTNEEEIKKAVVRAGYKVVGVEKG